MRVDGDLHQMVVLYYFLYQLKGPMLFRRLECFLQALINLTNSLVNTAPEHKLKGVQQKSHASCICWRSLRRPVRLHIYGL